MSCVPKLFGVAAAAERGHDHCFQIGKRDPVPPLEHSTLITSNWISNWNDDIRILAGSAHSVVMCNKEADCKTARSLT